MLVTIKKRNYEVGLIFHSEKEDERNERQICRDFVHRFQHFQHFMMTKYLDIRSQKFPKLQKVSNERFGQI
jgi:hypothetical protein